MQTIEKGQTLALRFSFLISNFNRWYNRLSDIRFHHADYSNKWKVWMVQKKYVLHYLQIDTQYLPPTNWRNNNKIDYIHAINLLRINKDSRNGRIVWACSGRFCWEVSGWCSWFFRSTDPMFVDGHYYLCAESNTPKHNKQKRNQCDV